MYGRFTLFTPSKVLHERFKIEDTGLKLIPKYNIAPTQLSPIIRSSAPTQFSLAAWGLKPAWLKEKSDQIINVRSDSLDTKPVFAADFAERRCLIPADGFYEWGEENGVKTPFRVAFADRSPFAFAGIWEPMDIDGNAEFAFAIITVDANEAVKPIHGRMPAILRPEDEQIWLDINHSKEEALGVLKPYQGEGLVAFPVSSLVNSPKYDAPSLIVPIHHRGA